MTAVHTTHWEGGKGCRNKIKMNRYGYRPAVTHAIFAWILDAAKHISVDASCPLFTGNFTGNSV